MTLSYLIRDSRASTAISIHQVETIDESDAKSLKLVGTEGRSSLLSTTPSPGPSPSTSPPKKRRNFGIASLTRSFSSNTSTTPKRLSTSELIKAIESVVTAIGTLHKGLHRRMVRLEGCHPLYFPIFGAPGYGNRDPLIDFTNEMAAIFKFLEDDIRLLNCAHKSSKAEHILASIEEVRVFWEDINSVLDGFPYIFRLNSSTSSPPTSIQEISDYVNREIINRKEFDSSTWAEICCKLIGSRYWQPSTAPRGFRFRDDQCYQMLWPARGKKDSEYADEYREYEAALNDDDEIVWVEFARAFREKELQRRRPMNNKPEVMIEEEVVDVEDELPLEDIKQLPDKRFSLRRWTGVRRRSSGDGSRRSSFYSFMRKKGESKGKGIAVESDSDSDVAIIEDDA